MTTDVFVRVCCLDQIRWAFAVAAITRWRRENDIRLRIIQARDPFMKDPWKDKIDIRLPLENFWTLAKQYAEDHAQSPIYVLADDDQLIIGKDWVNRGVKILEGNPDYGLLSAWSINGEVYERPGEDPHVFPIDSNCGCPYFIRKGILKKFPDAPIGQQDHAMCEKLKEPGWKIGFLKTVRYNHLGAHYSTAIPENWSA